MYSTTQAINCSDVCWDGQNLYGLYLCWIRSYALCSAYMIRKTISFFFSNVFLSVRTIFLSTQPCLSSLVLCSRFVLAPSWSYHTQRGLCHLRQKWYFGGLWKISLLTLRTKRRHAHLKRPNGVIIVVIKLGS